MSTTTYGRGSAWTGWAVFAAAVLFVVGAIDVIQGLVALFKDEVYVIAESGLLVATDWTTWGWVLIAWGAVLLLAGVSLFSGRGWARWFAIVAVVLNLIVQIAWFPAFPLWSIVAIALDVAVLYALTAGWKDVQAELRM